MMLTYAELFAGAGGLSMGLEAAGFHAIATPKLSRTPGPCCAITGLTRGWTAT